MHFINASTTKITAVQRYCSLLTKSFTKMMVHSKLSLAGGDASQGRRPWSMVPPTTASKQFRQFGMCPKKIVYAALLVNLVTSTAWPQCSSSIQFSEKLTNIEAADLPYQPRLIKVIALKDEYDRCRLSKDSLYARILHRIGALYFNTGNAGEAIKFTAQAISINTSGQPGGNRKSAINNFFNLGMCYEQLRFYKQALNSYDRCILIGNEYRDAATLSRISRARLKKGNIYFQSGDYEKDAEEITLALETASTNDSVLMSELLTERAQAYGELRSIKEALNDLKKGFLFISGDQNTSYANNYKIRAAISNAVNNYREAMAYYTKAILARKKTDDIAGLAGDYLDAGNTLRREAIRKNSGNFSAAQNYYTTALRLARKAGNDVMAVKALNNLAIINFRTKKYFPALTGYHTSLQLVATQFKDTNSLLNPSYGQCNAVSDKNVLSLILGNKTECLLHLYKQTSGKAYLTAALTTALLTDSLIADMRHEQTNEQSKLYWRKETREFFSNAIEACYEAQDIDLAFYFMEKSRAVLLNDKLNELGASAQLPAAEALEEQKMHINVVAHQQQIARLNAASPVYNKEAVKLFTASEALNRYIKTLETRYPAYYQYKYDEAVPALPELKKYLAGNKQSFVHYFISDTAVYMLFIAPFSSSFIKQGRKNFNAVLFNFLAMCADRSLLNNHYDSFASQSNYLYKTLFEPLAAPGGRIIICGDAVTIPFEALLTKAKGHDFIVQNYQFSYVYSARFLLKNFKNPPGKGNFLGVAPVSYTPYLSVPSLMQSGIYLQELSAYYRNHKVIMNREANRKNLLKLLPGFTVVAILSHARADSTHHEPLLYMSDSIVRLSELQLLRDPATELIVLSACETNVGRLAVGEGIFSLARGFASAGIPSVTATLWKADEQAIYTITNIFLKKISQGMRKDDALQKAKLSFMQNGSAKNLLPYYWANMILAGNGEPVALQRDYNTTWWLGGAIVLITIILLAYIIRKRNKAGVYNAS